MWKKVELPEWTFTQSILEQIMERRRWVHYLEVIDGPWREYLTIPLDQRAIDLLTTHVAAYMQKGVEPPAEIRTTVMNIADDLLAEREPVVRTGDYIAVQTMLRHQK